jgi:hypothetical protein
MRILLATTVFAIACGGTSPKKESSMVSEGADQSPTCCCKTMPTTAEKELVPNYAMTARMECSTAHGSCVDDVQCAGQEGESQNASSSSDGVPPPPDLDPSE